MWDVTVKSGKRLDAFDQWCLRRILQVPFTAHVTNQVVRTRSAQPPVTQTITARGVWDSSATSSVQIQTRTTSGLSTLDDPPKYWRRPRGRPRQTWLRKIENDLKPQSVVCPAHYDRELWHEIVETATLLQGHATWWWWWYNGIRWHLTLNTDCVSSCWRLPRYLFVENVITV